MPTLKRARKLIRELSPAAQHSLAFLVLSLLVAAVYEPVIAGHAALRTSGPWPPGGLFVSDPAAGGSITLPLERLVAASWSHLTLPIIDPFQGNGIPLLANQSVPVFPPEIIFHLLFPNNYSLWEVARLVILGFGLYLLARSLEMTFFASLTTAVAGMFIGVVPPNINMGMLNPIAVFPYVLLAVRYLLDPNCRKRSYAFLAVITGVACLALSGFQEVLPLLAVVAMAFIIGLLIHFRHTPGIWRSAAVTAIAGASGVLIGSIGLIPTVVSISHGAALNPPTSYTSSAATYWVSTLTVPTIASKALVARPPDLGQSVWLLGTPVLIVVPTLALFLCFCRKCRDSRWFLWPSIVLVIFGLFGFVNAGHVLNVFDFFPLNSVAMTRFLQFAWWIPWCLLLGAVIAFRDSLRWYVTVLAFGVAFAFDFRSVQRFRSALTMAHLSKYLTHTRDAALVSALVLLAFTVLLLLNRWRFAAVGLAVVVTASSIYYLPSNFFASTGNDVVEHLQVRDESFLSHGTYLTYDTTELELPVFTYSFQAFSPLIPKSYGTILNAVVPLTRTIGGGGALFGAAPTLYLANIDRGLMRSLTSLGVNVIVSESRLKASEVGSIMSCRDARRAAREVCYDGTGYETGTGQPERQFIYLLPRASPVVDRVTSLMSKSTTGRALTATIDAVRMKPGVLPEVGYIAVGKAHIGLKLAEGTQVRTREAQATSVNIVLKVRRPGVVVLRESYFTGMRAVVDGASEPVYPVDGQFYSAVRVPKGVVHVRLLYSTGQTEVEYWLALGGSAVLLLGWVILGARVLKRRRKAHLRVPRLVGGETDVTVNPLL